MAMQSATQIQGVLSPAARSVLAEMGGARIGQVPQPHPTRENLAAMRELRSLGVLAAHDGLTTRGSVVAMRVQAAAERASFGAL